MPDSELLDKIFEYLYPGRYTIDTGNNEQHNAVFHQWLQRDFGSKFKRWLIRFLFT